MRLRDVLPLWWAWQWRVLVAVIVANFLIGFLVTFIGALLSLSKVNMLIISNLISLGVTIFASIYFLAYLFEKFGIYLAKSDDIYKKAAIK